MDDMDGSGWAAFGAQGSGRGCFCEPNGVSADAMGRILVADSRNHRVVRIDDMDGSGWVSIGGPGPGEGPGRFTGPRSVAADPSGWIYVSNRWAGVVRMDDMDGTGWISFRPANLSTRRHSLTRGIAVDAERLAFYLVLDMNACVVRIDGLTGLRWRSLEERPRRIEPAAGSFSGFAHPFGIALDSRRRIYIANSGNHRIIRMDDILGNGWTEFPGEEP
jgi:streptogramin lyase